MLLDISSTPERQIFPGEEARIISPMFPSNYRGHEKCLIFSMNVHGQHVGTVRVLDEYGRMLYRYVGNKWQNIHLTEWLPVSVQLDPWQILFVIEATKGGVYSSHGEGDICIDDISVIADTCRKYRLLLSSLCTLNSTLILFPYF